LLDPKLFGLKPGPYRVEAALSGWDEEKFSDAERSELARMGCPFMKGEVSDSISHHPNTQRKVENWRKRAAWQLQRAHEDGNY